jgi:chromosome segregation ATPase
MLTPEQEVRLNNFEAQYSTILGNIATANRELEIILEEKNTAQAAIDKYRAGLDADISDKRRELSALLAYKAVAEKEVISQHAQTASAHRKEQEHLDSIKALTRKENLLNQEISKREKKTDKLIDEYNSINTAIEKFGRKLADLRHDISKLSTLRNELKNETVMLEGELQNMKAGLMLELKKLAVDIQTLLEKRRVEESKIVEADKYLIKEKEIISRRERDVITVTKRLEKLFQEVRPGMKLKL